jgi:hypothetical protein
MGSPGNLAVEDQNVLEVMFPLVSNENGDSLAKCHQEIGKLSTQAGTAFHVNINIISNSTAAQLSAIAPSL